jgi:hypothetical protein
VDKGAEKETFVSKYFSTLLIAGTLALSLLVSGCSFSPDESSPSPAATETVNTDTAKLTGYWKSSYGDGFAINGTSFTQYDNAAKDVSFAGTVVNVRNLSATSGYLTILVTDTGTWGKTVGYYYVMAWANLSATGIDEATAYKVGGAVNNGIQDRIAAENEYTIGNGYFGYLLTSEYLKQ